MSDIFYELLNKAKSKIKLEPQLENKFGRSRDDFEAYQEVCRRHEFELILFPEALREQWPTELNYKVLIKRIFTLTEPLCQVSRNPRESKLLEALNIEVRNRSDCQM